MGVLHGAGITYLLISMTCIHCGIHLRLVSSMMTRTHSFGESFTGLKQMVCS